MFDIIIAATDGSPAAGKAVRLAGEVAAARAAKLVLTHVLDPDMTDDELRRFAANEDFGTWRPAEPYLDPISAARGGVRLATADRQVRELDLIAAAETVGQRILLQAHGIASEAGATLVETELRRGKPAEEIVEAAGQHGADSVFLGTCGHAAVAEVLLGSVARHVSRRSDVTCVTVS